ncbi:MAG: AbrB/MazE/SpoVT family DNA-binding domain-containing protein [Abditibacteriales bacterium]|nr:AbrB/MazE/SpoVT family DNA-binding domain-containing protein [Abditibacteriales bacterium]MDW8364213.1 AbrB/MazE/SpoVT family DNA-binding domain-containing protein [Abditibacteriales bacterium]
MAQEPIRLRAEADGSIRIPAEVARQVGMRENQEVLLQVGASRLTLLSPSDPRARLEAFTRRVKGELGDVDSSYRMSDGRTVEEYLALSEEQRTALWEEAFREAMDELAKEPERDASADYVSAGQRHRARRVRSDGAPRRRSPAD